MYTISQIVKTLLKKDTQAFNYLKQDLLNTSVYADKILNRVESILLKKVKKGSIVTALARIKLETQSQKLEEPPKFTIKDLSLKLPITELVYKKDKNPNPNLSKIYQKLQKTEGVHFNLINIADELDIFISSHQAETVKKFMLDFELVLEETSLSALILKYDPAYRQFHGMASQVLNVLAVNSIIFLECLTTYSEFVIYIKQDKANQAIEYLKEEFMYNFMGD